MTKRYELGLGRNYVLDWDIWFAIREFIQNAIDQEKTIEDNKMSIDYDEENKILRICNKKSILEHHTLLLGSTSKKDDDNTIGMFGEGYKLALLVLTRENKKVTIYNYGKREVWNCKFSKLKKYDYVETLVIDIDTAFPFTKVPNNDLTIQIEGITPEEFEKVKENTLMLKGDYTYIPTFYGNILDEEKFAGQIYINGLKVCDKEEFKYGYDFLPAYLKIGRDRNIIDSCDMQQLTRKMWILSNKTKEIKELMGQSTYRDCKNMYCEVNPFFPSEVDIKNQISQKAKEISESSFNDFIDEYGDNTLIANSEDEKTQLQRKYKGTKIIVANTDLSEMIKSSEKYKSMENNLEQKDSTIYDKILDWASEQYVSRYGIDKLFEIIAPLIEAYEEKNNTSFYEDAV